MVVTKRGLFTWGRGDAGRLGHGSTQDELVPKLVAALSEDEILMISAGLEHSMAVTKRGLFTWGHGGAGRLGHSGPQDELVPKMIVVLSGDEILMISAGAVHSMAVTKRGLFTWGWLGQGRAGHGSAQNELVPKLVAALSGDEILMISAGIDHSMAVTKRGLFTWGHGGFGRLGHGSAQDELVPKLVAALSGDEILMISAGYQHSMAVTKRGLFTWGCGFKGQLGHGSAQDELVPKLVAVLSGDEILMISAGAEHSMAVTKRGLFTWGRGDAG